MARLAQHARRSTGPFAHLARARAAECDPDDKTAENDDTSPDDDTGAEDDDPDQKARRARSEENPDDQETLSEEEMDREDEAADEQDQRDEDEDTDQDTELRQSARSRERARCSAIFRRVEAGLAPAMAAHLAFNTNLSRREAVGALKAAVASMPRRQRRAAAAPANTLASLRTRQIQAGAPRAVRPDAPLIGGAAAANPLAQKLALQARNFRRK